MLKKVCVPASTSSPTNSFAIPDTTIVIGMEIFALPVMLANNCNASETTQVAVNALVK